MHGKTLEASLVTTWTIIAEGSAESRSKPCTTIVIAIATCILVMMTRVICGAHNNKNADLRTNMNAIETVTKTYNVIATVCT